MAKPGKRQAADTADATNRSASPIVKKQRLSVFLVTSDDGLWPHVGMHIGNDLIAKQVDTIDELLTATQPGQPGIVLWDARGYPSTASGLTRLLTHSARFAIVALDESNTAAAWTHPIEHRQVVGWVGIPITASNLAAALVNAQEEAYVRLALLGDHAASDGAAHADVAGPATVARKRRTQWIGAAVCGAAVVAATVLMFARHENAPADLVPSIRRAPVEGTVSAPMLSGKGVSTEDRVDTLIGKAQQAMLERHFIDPVDASALSFYREALILSPDSGEARQGMRRVAEILFSRVQSALDEHKFDVALLSLEAARSISPNDGRLPVLDERIASVRAELGPAQIQAALIAQNFERATQLIDEAARVKSLSPTKLNQLRDEIRRRRDELEAARFATLIDTRLQQDRLIDPPHDNAAFYLIQARAAGVSASSLQPQVQEFNKRALADAHGAIDARRFADADRLLAELHVNGAAAAALSNLQHDLGAARTQQPIRDKTEGQQYLDLARARLASGNVVEPPNDSALTYVNQLRAAEPQNAALGQISGAVQAQIIDQARTALDAGQLTKAETLMQQGGGLGVSADMSALSERLIQAKLAAATPSSAPMEVTEAALTRLTRLEPDYPRQAAARDIGGWVEFAFIVKADGRVDQIKVLDSSPRGVFDSAAQKALARMRYKPLMQGGKAVAASTKIRITFRMAV
jgi:TonB family protein